jgi:hypothetical protein
MPPPPTDRLQRSTIDAIVFQYPSETLYRPHGEHPHKAGEGRVCRVLTMQISRPLPRRPATVENICGKFRAAFQRGRHDAVTLSTAHSFGRQREMYHLHGSLFLFRHCVHFKGCKSAAGVAALARDLDLAEDPRADVYMAVFSLAMDRFVHTYHGCYLENRLSERFGSVRVCHRMLDVNMLVKLRVERFSHREMPTLGEDLTPTSMDIMVSKKGVVLIRMSWRRCEWDAPTEARLLAFCDWLGGAVRECC